MENNKHYWVGKTQRAEIATTHTQEMEREYSREITASAKKSRVYGPEAVNTHLIDKGGTPRIKILSLDSVAAIFQEAEGKSCVLNFASFKNPGGMFLAGSRAQEESFCHESFLYNVLQSRIDYYEWNRKNLNRALYKNRALYSPHILFSRSGQAKTCDVLTCAAPNYSAASKYFNVSCTEKYTVLKQRIHFLLSVAAENKVDTLILGAFGCGVFGQAPAEVAKIFHQGINNIFGKRNIKIIFAIPKTERDRNFESFEREFGG